MFGFHYNSFMFGFHHNSVICDTFNKIPLFSLLVFVSIIIKVA